MRQMMNRARMAAGAALLVAILFAAVASRGQMQSQAPPNRGSLSGTVTADQGAVVGFRVTVHNLTYKLWYTVFTVKGHYTVPQALPGAYDVLVLEKGYTSPTLRVDLAPGESKTVDIAVKNLAAQTAATQGASTEGMNAAAGGPGGQDGFRQRRHVLPGRVQHAGQGRVADPFEPVFQVCERVHKPVCHRAEAPERQCVQRHAPRAAIHQAVQPARLPLEARELLAAAVRYAALGAAAGVLVEQVFQLPHPALGDRRQDAADHGGGEGGVSHGAALQSRPSQTSTACHSLAGTSPSASRQSR